MNSLFGSPLPSNRPPSHRATSTSHRALEKEADRLIRESMKGQTKHSDKADILTPWKLGDRMRREVYVASGTPDSAYRSGMFHRAANPARPSMNSVPPSRRR